MKRPTSIILEKPPLAVEVQGAMHAVDADFRTCIRIASALQDPDSDGREKLSVLWDLFFVEKPPLSAIEDAVSAYVWFMRCGEDEKPPEKQGSGSPQRPEPRVLDYNIDAKLLYSAFLDQYGVDLQMVDFLHWWNFQAMLSGLREEHLISKIIGYRSVDLRKIKDKKQRSFYAQMQKRYALPVHQKSSIDMTRGLGAAFF